MSQSPYYNKIKIIREIYICKEEIFFSRQFGQIAGNLMCHKSLHQIKCLYTYK